MTELQVYNQVGEKVSTAKLDPKIWEVKVNPELISRVVRAQEANARWSTANAKTRGMVRGGGAKPWRQKGTGRARAGSNRSPIWRGGGVVFGPSTKKNYQQKINRQEKVLALKMALVDRFNEGAKLLDTLSVNEAKTKEAVVILRKLEVVKGLVVMEKMDEKVKRAFNNLAGVELVSLSELGVGDVVRYPKLLMTVGALEAMTKRFSQRLK